MWWWAWRSRVSCPSITKAPGFSTYSELQLHGVHLHCFLLHRLSLHVLLWSLSNAHLMWQRVLVHTLIVCLCLPSCDWWALPACAPRPSFTHHKGEALPPIKTKNGSSRSNWLGSEEPTHQKIWEARLMSAPPSQMGAPGRLSWDQKHQLIREAGKLV